MSNSARAVEENSQFPTELTAPAIAPPISASRRTETQQHQQYNLRSSNNSAVGNSEAVSSSSNNNAANNSDNNIGIDIGNNDSNATQPMLLNNAGNHNSNGNNLLSVQALNGFHNLNGFHSNGITTPTTITLSNPITDTITTGNGNLVGCHEALTNFRVFRLANNSNGNGNTNGNRNGNNSDTTATGYRGRVRQRLHRDIYNMRRSLKAMNKTLNRTNRTLRRLKVLILQQGHFFRELRLILS